jgi:glutamate N-acetyltransferase/amino-acid N-acetyltransferase
VTAPTRSDICARARWPFARSPAATSTAGAFQPDELNVAINGVWVCRRGAVGDERSKVDLGPREVTVTVDLSAGSSAATVWTTDLTIGYVHENSAYST